MLLLCTGLPGHGNTELVRFILHHQPPLENADNEFKSIPLGWTIHGSENGWDRQKGDYAGTGFFENACEKLVI